MATENIAVEWSISDDRFDVVAFRRTATSPWIVLGPDELIEVPDGELAFFGRIWSSTTDENTVAIALHVVKRQLGVHTENAADRPAAVWISHKGTPPPKLSNGLVLLGASTEQDHSHSTPPVFEAETQAVLDRLTDELVAVLGGCKIHIYPDEHPPPHFHVRAAGENASFAISNCERVDGTAFKLRTIRRWWKDNRAELKRVWNDTRPADCPVGPIEE